MDMFYACTPDRLGEERLKYDIMAGKYGNLPLENFPKLNRRESRAVLHFLARQKDRTGTCFLEMLKLFFPKSLICHYGLENKILVYLPYPEKEANESGLTSQEKLSLLEYFFLDLASAEIEYYWEIPFALLGESYAPRLDNCKIY